VVSEKGDVLERLEDQVEDALRQSRCVEDSVLALFGALQELAQPCVERWDA
jgi:hypothetical protein